MTALLMALSFLPVPAFPAAPIRVPMRLEPATCPTPVRVRLQLDPAKPIVVPMRLEPEATAPIKVKLRLIEPVPVRPAKLTVTADTFQTDVMKELKAIRAELLELKSLTVKSSGGSCPCGPDCPCGSTINPVPRPTPGPLPASGVAPAGSRITFDDGTSATSDGAAWIADGGPTMSAPVMRYSQPAPAYQSAPIRSLPVFGGGCFGGSCASGRCGS